MFGKTKVMTETRMISYPTPSLPTLDIVKHSTAVGFEHKVKQLQIMREPVPSNDIVVRMAQSGFRWVVDGSIVGEFQYHASLRTISEHSHNVYARIGDGIVYQGDVPDGILDNIQKAVECGIRYVTIHSNQPMPISYTMADPVALGWSHAPQINVSYPSRNTGSFGSLGNSAFRRHFAFVLGVWDEDGIVDICLNHSL